MTTAKCREQECWPSLGQPCPITRADLLTQLEPLLQRLSWAFGIDEESPHDDQVEPRDFSRLTKSTAVLNKIQAAVTSDPA